MQPDESRIVSGTIEHFFLDYVGEIEQRFEVLVTFKVNRTDAAVFASDCRSDLRQSMDWMKSGLLIKRGIKDCIEQFMNSAQAPPLYERLGTVSTEYGTLRALVLQGGHSTMGGIDTCNGFLNLTDLVWSDGPALGLVDLRRV